MNLNALLGYNSLPLFYLCRSRFLYSSYPLDIFEFFSKRVRKSESIEERSRSMSNNCFLMSHGDLSSQLEKSEPFLLFSAGALFNPVLE